MAIDRQYMLGKIRAMRHAGYADHEIGYACGWDCGIAHEEVQFREYIIRSTRLINNLQIRLSEMHRRLLKQ